MASMLPCTEKFTDRKIHKSTAETSDMLSATNFKRSFRINGCTPFVEKLVEKVDNSVEKWKKRQSFGNSRQ